MYSFKVKYLFLIFCSLLFSINSFSAYYGQYIIAFEDRIDNSLSSKDDDFNDFVMSIKHADMGTLTGFPPEITQGLVSIKPIMLS